MENLIVFLNSAGKSLIGFAWPMLLQSSLLILILLSLDFALRRKVKAVFRYAVWMLVLVKLVLPASLAVPTGLGWWFADKMPQAITQNLTVPTTEITPSFIPQQLPPEYFLQTPPEYSNPSPASINKELAPTIDPSMQPETPANLNTTLSPEAIVFLIWLAVVITLLLLMIQKLFLVKGLLAQAAPASDQMKKILVRCAEQMHLKQKIDIKLSHNINSPSVCGLIHPIVLIPANLNENLDPHHLNAILLHECAHIKRRDLWINLFQALLQIIYFYHPLLWIANAVIRQTREQAVDEMVLVALGKDAEQYPETLVSIFRLSFKRPSLGLRFVGVVESKSTLKKRIQHMINHPLPKTAKLSILSCAVIVLIAVILLPMAAAQPESNQNSQTKNDPAQNPNNLNEKQILQIVQGVVKNKQGDVIEGAKVILYNNTRNWELKNRLIEQTETTPDGDFRFKNPLNTASSTESFLLLAFHPDFALAWHKILPTDQRSDYELILTQPTSKTIKVTDLDGNPLPGARVWPYNIGNPQSPESLFRDTVSLSADFGIVSALTDAQGNATVTNLPDTHSHFHADLPGYSQGLAFPGQKRIRLNKGASVSGKVLDQDGNPVPDAIVRWGGYRARTNARGQFHFTDLSAQGWDQSPWGISEPGSGSYKITIEHDKYVAPETQDLLLPGENVENFIIDAYRACRVICKVVEIDTDKPLPGTRLYGSNEIGRIEGYADQQGVFTISVMPGETSLSFYSPPQGVYILDRRQRPPESHLRFVAQGDEMTVTLKTPRIAGNLTTVTGAILLPDGSPAGGLRICTTNSATYDGGGFSGTGGAYTAANPDGTFELNDVPAGLKLFIYGLTEDRKFALAHLLDKLDQPTVLTEPLIMQPTQTSDLLLTDIHGQPLSDMRLRIQPMHWGHHIFRADKRTVTTDARGRLKIDGILPGMQYFLRDARAKINVLSWTDHPQQYLRLIPTKQQINENLALEKSGVPTAVLSTKVIICVKDSEGRSIPIDSILEINAETVYGKRSRPGPFEIENRLPDGSVIISREHLASNEPGCQLEIKIFTADERTLRAYTVFPDDASNRINFQLGQPPEENPTQNPQK